MLRPEAERQEIKAPVSGFVADVHAGDNQIVRKGEQLVGLRTDEASARGLLLQSQLDRISSDIAALEELLTTPSRIHDHAAVNAAYAIDLTRYWAELGSSSAQLTHARRELQRSEMLAARGLAPATAVEEHASALERLRSDSVALVATHRARWATELQTRRSEQARLLTEVELGAVESAAHSITAPAAGTLDEVTPISAGSYVASGTTLFVLSRSSEPVAEVYVPARDIGLVQTGGGVRLRVDSFDYATWGHLHGTVRSIAPDHVVMNETPMFVVEVALASTSLSAGEGITATVGPGMTVQAHLDLAERSLWQLLRDDVNSWLNPNLP